MVGDNKRQTQRALGTDAVLGGKLRQGVFEADRLLKQELAHSAAIA